ncbi:hypothetical protein L2K70_02335 [Nocardioides KLBMP 9356]|uniref:PD-(D/E)XK nuclease-like domain-containing protein n=1 Tax=Nocardioides potassii TaxID=2911371 RepID=A0ABS9H8J7_9ACTN|nr:hypothetical protein [Nocardioides potassii]MCF6376431.1 hypothetical protein [Nocardioides potassii]
MADTADGLPEPEPTNATVGDWDGVLPRDRDPATRRHRRHQGEWRSSTLRWAAGPPQDDIRVRARYETLPNWLAATDRGRDVVVDGPNVMSDEARSYTHGRLDALNTIDGKAEPDRLWRNLLSSQPMAFSIAGHLRAHRDEAAALLGAMTGLDVAHLGTLAPPDGTPAAHMLEGVEAEWFPPRQSHTDDKSGADVAACLDLTDNTRTLITIEVKFTDTFSPAPVRWTRYEEHLMSLGLDEEATKRLVDAGCSQVLRQVMLTDSVRRRGITADSGPDGAVEAGIAVVLARHDDKTAKRVANTLDEAVGSVVPVKFWSHRQLFGEAARIPGLSEWAQRMKARYVLK